MKKCKKITISGNEYPIRFDYLVLKEISDRYESIERFELDLLGLGKVGKNEFGESILRKTKDPSISCIMFVLPLMVNSALDYLGFELVDEKQIIKEIDLNYIELSGIIHEEMKSCFKSNSEVKKKYNPVPTRKKLKNFRMPKCSTFAGRS